MKTIYIKDQYNTVKTWVIKKYGCGTYYVNQEIQGKMFYRRFARMTKRQLAAIGLAI